MSPDETATPVERDQPDPARPSDELRGREGGSNGRGAVPKDPASVLRIDEARRRRLRPWAIVGAIGIVAVTGSVALSYTSILGARMVEVEGEDRLPPRRVMRLAQIELGTNVLHLDTGAAEARLEADRWILDATVATQLPSTITITIRERSPVLVMSTSDEMRLVAADGTVLGPAPRSVALPQVVTASGDAMERKDVGIAGEVVQAMAPALRARVRTVTVAAGEVTLVVDGGIQVRYGAGDETAAKAQALRAILDHADEIQGVLLSVDLSSPSAPTARFAGSQPPSTGPDPSADTEMVSNGERRDGGEGRTEETQEEIPEEGDRAGG